MNLKTINLLGWLGVGAILGAYALLNFGFIKAESLFYILLNLGGSLAIIVETVTKKDYQPAALNSIWVLISLIALIRLLL